MDISVIIPTYKPKEYIKDCLTSLANQTLSKSSFEIIIILNGCNEPYYSFINKIINTLPEDINILFEQTDTPGVSNARNVGLDIAKGEFICFIDDDDYVSNTYLEQLLLHASKDVISLCKPLAFADGTTDYRPYGITKDYEKWAAYTQTSYIKARRFFNGPVYKLIHKSIIGNRRFNINFKNGEDSLFMFLISDCFSIVEFTDNTAIYYRRLRKGSAIENNKSLKYLLLNNFKLIKEQSRLYFCNIRKYNFVFYFNMVLSRFKSILNFSK